MPELITGEVIRKLNRLAAMRPKELTHRVREKLYVELDRIRAGIGNGGPPAAGAKPPGKPYGKEQAESERKRAQTPDDLDRLVDGVDGLDL